MIAWTGGDVSGGGGANVITRSPNGASRRSETVQITWWQVGFILLLEAFIDVLLDRVIKDPAGKLWSRFVDWICNREDRREAARREKRGM